MGASTRSLPLNPHHAAAVEAAGAAAAPLRGRFREENKPHLLLIGAPPKWGDREIDRLVQNTVENCLYRISYGKKMIFLFICCIKLKYFASRALMSLGIFSVISLGVILL